MKKTALLLLVTLLAACQTPPPRNENPLQGRWISNKTMSLQSASQHRVALDESDKALFGTMAYFFTADLTSFAPAAADIKLIKKYHYQIMKNSPDSISIRIAGYPLTESVVTFKKQGNCLALQQKTGFMEYFCKE